ncbi:hypothetical protein VTN96DRAFT_7709 [Rasamsonia emersonii]
MGEARDVPMDGIKFVSFERDSPVAAIGTQDLKGCSVAMIVSTHGALMAHIPPMPYRTLDPHAGERHVHALMHRMLRPDGVRVPRLFSATSRLAAVVCATVDDGQVALPGQVDLMCDMLVRYAGVSRVRVAGYEVVPSPNYGAEGTVFIDGRRGCPFPPKIYVEDHEMGWFS